MNVLVIPEDFRHDQHILKPLIEKMLVAAGKPKSIVRVCNDPLMGGVSEALSWDKVRNVLDRYRGMVRLFLLIVDRDGDAHRRQALDKLEAQAKQFLPSDRCLLAENAWQELEVWALAGMNDLPAEWSWRAIREEAHAKERYFEPYVQGRRLTNEPGQGRTTLGREAARNYPRVRSLCTEDVASLEARIKEWIKEA